MKRKITDLEKKLLEKGYTLVGKQYTGKFSQKTYCYVYQNGNNAIKIDYTRTKIIDFALVGVFNDGVIDKTKLVTFNTRFKALNEFVDSLFDKKEKPVNVPNSELDEREELGAMTPEQFDELCQEKEREK